MPARRRAVLVTCLAVSALTLLAGCGTAHRPARGADVTAGKGAWAVVGLGDSVTSGYHCDCTPFVQQYAALTARRTGRPMTADNLGVNGLTTSGLLAQLGSSDVAQPVSGADIVLVTIGANDAAESLARWSAGHCDQACLQAGADEVGSTLDEVLDRIRTLRDGLPTEILVTTYWNVVQDGVVARGGFSAAYLRASDTLTRAVNAAICTSATASAASCVDLYRPFKQDGSADPTPLLAADGDHPDAAGHALVARTLASVGWRVLGGPA